MLFLAIMMPNPPTFRSSTCAVISGSALCSGLKGIPLSIKVMLITDDSASYSIHTVIVPSDFTLFSGIGILFAIAWYVLQIIARWKALIPFYNSYTQYELTWSVSMFWLVIALSLAGDILNSLIGGGLIRAIAGIMAFAAMIIEYPMANHKLSKSFGHGVGFTIGLLLFESIFMLILGFGKSEYIGNTTKNEM